MTDGAVNDARVLEFADAMRTGCAHLYGYWNRLRGDRVAPAWGEFKLWDLPPAVIPNTRVIEIRYDPFDAVYIFWGTGMTEAYHREMTGRSLTELGPERVKVVMDEMRQMAEDKAPDFYMADFHQVFSRNTDWLRRAPQLCPSVRVPIVNADGRLTHVVSYTDFSPEAARTSDL